MADEVIFTPEEQAILDANRAPAEESEVPEGYNTDGTIKEELIAGKFKTNEDLLKAYQELEKKLGQPKETIEEAKEAPKEVPKEAEGLITPDDFNQYSDEFNKSGKLSEETYTALEKKGISKPLVDAYISGQQAIQEAKAQKLLAYVGGQEEYNNMIAWAKENYSKEQAEAFDEALFSGNETRVQDQVDLLAMRMGKRIQRTPTRIEGTSVSSGGMATFSDKGEWIKATENPLYGKDAKYTNMIDKRYLASKKAGTL